jgi:hypothetical protein
MKRHFKKPRGILIISVLFLTIILVMLATTIFSMVLIQQKNATAFYQRRAAEKVAQSGINYAMMRLETDLAWRGCVSSDNREQKEAFKFKSLNIDGIEIYEHSVKDDLGFVEGKIKLGPHTGYFDLYFVKPGDKSMGEFIGKEAGSFPENIILSQNNSLIVGQGVSDVFDFSGSSIPNKKIPANSVLLVCRGRVGDYTKTIETCFRMGPPGDFNSVVVGKGDIRINIHGRNNYDKIVLDDFLGSGPSIMRSVGSMLLGISPRVSRDLDYLMVTGKSGGRADESNPRFSPVPASGSVNFRKEPGQANFIPKLEMDNVMPKEQGRTLQLSGGIYFIKPDPENNNYPIVGYYRENSSSPILTTPTFRLPTPDADLSADFRKHINNGAMEWDAKARRLTFLNSCNIDRARGRGSHSIRDISFISVDNERLTVQLGRENLEEGSKPVYFINKNSGGNIYVDGQLSGSGTVICDGNLDMQAESQLSAAETTGISVYAGGTVTVNEITDLPYIEVAGTNKSLSGLIEEYNIKQSIHKKIHQFISENPYDNKYASTRQIDAQRPDGTTYFPAEYQGLADWHKIPLDYFTPEEQEYVKPLTTFDPKLGKRVFYTDSSPEGYLNEYVNPTVTGVTSETQAFTGISSEVKFYRVWGLQKTFDISEKVETKYDFKGRPINIKDSIFRGLVYTCADFIVKTPNRSFILEGGLVAAGNKSGTGGNIKIDAVDCRFTYDTRYLSLLSLAGTGKIKTLYWSSY